MSSNCPFFLLQLAFLECFMFLVSLSFSHFSIHIPHSTSFESSLFYTLKSFRSSLFHFVFSSVLAPQVDGHSFCGRAFFRFDLRFQICLFLSRASWSLVQNIIVGGKIQSSDHPNLFVYWTNKPTGPQCPAPLLSKLV